MPAVKPELLIWARETAGLSRPEAAEGLALKATRGLTAEQRLAALETGEVPPSSAMLNRMAKLYRRPLIAFYLAAPLGRVTVERTSAACPELPHQISIRTSTR